MTDKPIENENMAEDVPENENVTSDLPEEVVRAVRKSQQLTYERARKLAEALSAAASSAVHSLPGRQLAHRLPAPPFADGLPKLPKLPESAPVRTAARDYASQLFAEQRRFAHEVVAEQRRFAGELVSAVSASHPAGHDGEATPAAE
jgi:cell division septum initiation protein DivIVA